jgi:hypothetical protein
VCRTRARRESRYEAVADRPGSHVDPEIRASDADRERVVQSLRDHGAAGRLSTEELEERIAAALDARTFGDLDRLLTDLPARPDPRRSEARREAARRGFREHLRSYVAVMALLVAIWALTGMGYFWPIWPMVGWGIGLWSHAACLPRRRRAAAPDPLVQI